MVNLKKPLALFTFALTIALFGCSVVLLVVGCLSGYTGIIYSEYIPGTHHWLASFSIVMGIFLFTATCFAWNGIISKAPHQVLCFASALTMIAVMELATVFAASSYQTELEPTIQHYMAGSLAKYPVEKDPEIRRYWYRLQEDLRCCIAFEIEGAEVINENKTTIDDLFASSTCCGSAGSENCTKENFINNTRDIGCGKALRPHVEEGIFIIKFLCLITLGIQLMTMLSCFVFGRLASKMQQ